MIQLRLQLLLLLLREEPTYTLYTLAPSPKTLKPLHPETLEKAILKPSTVHHTTPGPKTVKSYILRPQTFHCSALLLFWWSLLG